MKLVDAFDPKNNSIGAMRLACALAVIVGHAHPHGGYGTHPIMVLTGYQVTFARAAVDIFFVMSGFLLASSWERSSLVEYARNRFLRIFPALWVCLLVTGVAAPLAFGLAPGAEYVFRNAFLFFGIHNTIPGLFADNISRGVNGPLWTLPWELYCYVSLPFIAIVGLFNRRTAILIFVALWIAFVFKITSTETISDKSAIASPFRLFSFFYAGVVIHLWRDKIGISGRLALAAAVVLAAATALGVMISRHAGGLFYVVAPITLSYLVIFAAVRLPFTRINHRTDISYGLYIYGTFIIQVLVALGLGASIVSYPVFAIVCVAFAVPVALLSWHLVEKPSLAFRRRSADRAFIETQTAP